MEMHTVEQLRFYESLSQNISTLSAVFQGDALFTLRHFQTAGGRSCVLVFFDGMIDTDIVDREIIMPLMSASPENLSEASETAVAADTVALTDKPAKAVEKLLHGDALLLLDGDARALVCSAKGYARRGIEEPEGERLVRGPREGFTESLVTNTALLRRKLLTPDLKLIAMNPSSLSRQRLIVAYLDTQVDRPALHTVLERLRHIELAIALDTRRLDEALCGRRISLLRTIGSTERPDIAAAKLMEGKILLMLDGTPSVSTLPFLFIEYFQTGDDYYTGWLAGSIGRVLRILGFCLSVILPASYQALITCHQEIIPRKFLISIAAARSGVPFPTILEMLLMLAAFEILREGGSMMPGSVGQALSTVGAVVVGQAAVDARIVSAPLVIITAATGLCAMMTPKLAAPGLVMRTFLLILSAFTGLYGVVFGMVFILGRMFSLDSFHTPYMSFTGTLRPKDLRDTLIRTPHGSASSFFQNDSQ